MNVILTHCGNMTRLLVLPQFNVFDMGYYRFILIYFQVQFLFNVFCDTSKRIRPVMYMV